MPLAPASVVPYTGPLTLGIDLAKWQGKPPFPALWDAGVRFVYQKITHGTSGVDETFQANWKAMRAFRAAAGVDGAVVDGGRFRQGVYGWFVPHHDPTLQADFLCGTLEAAGYLDEDLPVSGDFEEVDNAIKGQALLDRYLTYRNRLRQNLGRISVVYTAKWYFDLVLSGVDCSELAEDPLWNATYPHLDKLGPKAYAEALRQIGPKTPAIPSCWRDAGKREDVRQFDGNGGLVMPNGVDADFDAYLGDVASLDDWSGSTWRRHTSVDRGGTFSSSGPAHTTGQADRAERDAEEILKALDSDPPDTTPGTEAARQRQTDSSQRMRAVKDPSTPPRES